MEEMTWLLTIVICLFAILFLYDERRLKRRNIEITELKEIVKRLELEADTGGSNRRDFFRLRLSGEECTLEFVDLENEALEKLKDRKTKARLLDISVTGLKMVCDYDLPVRKKVLVNTYLKIRGEEFVLKGVLLRKEEERLKTGVVYGLTFVEMDLEEQKKLNVAINRIQTDRHKKSAELAD